MRWPIAVPVMLCLAAPAEELQAQQPAAAASSETDKKPAAPEPKAEQSVTTHRLVMGGVAIDYTATAGTLIVRDDEEKPIASMGYVAYTRSGVKDPSTRPLMFAFNGGPGSSAIWLHMGALGPRRVVVTDTAPLPPAPYAVVDNEASVLDRTDLVLIDPVGTGISRAVGAKKDEDFWGVDPDIDSVSRFIAQYVSDNQRWASPKYLLGESYGTTRGTAIVDYLQSRRSMAFNGLVLVSVATDLGAIFAEIPGNDRPYALYLPGFAAVAWYHQTLPGARPSQLEPFLDEVRAYALGPYATALLKGDALAPAERDAVAAKLHEYTGLSVDYLKAARLRVTENAFNQELLRAKGRTVSRLDARFLGLTMDRLAKHAEYDPQASAIGAAFTAAFLDYYARELKFGEGRTYKPTNWAVGEKWKWTHKPAGAAWPQPFVDTGVDLAHAMVENVNLKVLVLNGYYDLATPFSATEYMMAHLGLPEGLGANIQMKYYEAGHMMYLHPPALKQMKADLDAFIDATSRR